MTDRAEALANATRWAEAAERHSRIFLDARAEEDVLSLAASELEEHAQRMALMWAAVAALHPVEQGSSFGRRFFDNAAATFADPIRSCMLPHVHDAHHWTSERGLQFGCVGFPEAKFNPLLGHCGCEKWDRGVLHAAHDWITDGGQGAHCNGTPPNGTVPCGYCGCADGLANCACDHDGTPSPTPGATA